jgi:two-component system cell cycle response regulator
VAERRVVVIDGDAETAGVLRWLFREQGYAAWSPNGGGSMVDDLERIDPDVVLIDAHSLDASRFVGRVREVPSLQGVRVIVAGEDGDGRAATIQRMGADDCVAKPYRVPELLTRIKAQIETRDRLHAMQAELMRVTEELERVRAVAAGNRQLVDILHDVTGELSAGEIYRVLTRRVARALELTHCTVVITPGAGASTGTVVASFDDSTMMDQEIQLDRVPEVGVALQTERRVLIENAEGHPLFAHERRGEAARGFRVRSSIALPFTIDRHHTGVLLIRTDRTERTLDRDDAEFAELVVRAAVAAIRRAQALETTRADNRRLEALATTDALTRVMNRRALLDRLSSEVDRARRFRSVLSVLLLDADHFKTINDTAGHLAGDGVLQQLAMLLQEAVRKVDVVARYGGEEFVIIVPETSSEGARVFAERLRERIGEHPFDVAGGDRDPLHLTVSIGIATFPAPRVDSTEDLFARADEALYRAKAGGRNQVCL